MHSSSVSVLHKLSTVKDLSNRRNKGRLWVGRDLADALYTVRTVNLAFSNSGESDGLSSSVLREIVLLKNVYHPNVVSVLFADWHAPGFVSVAFRHETLTLRDSLNSPSSTLRTAPLRIIIQILRALSFLHDELRVAHRNIRPENIFISPDGTAKLGDFFNARSISKRSNSPEPAKIRRATQRERDRLPYRAPEVLNRRSLSLGAADVFSVGAVWLEMRGRLPWAKAETEGELLQLYDLWLCKGKLRQEWVSGNSEEDGESMMKMLSINPEQRPTARAALNAVLNKRVVIYSVHELAELEMRTTTSFLSASWRAWAFEAGATFFGASSSVIWAAVWTFEKFSARIEPSSNPGSVLMVCLKMAARLETSYDSFRLSDSRRIEDGVEGVSTDVLLADERRVCQVLGFDIELPRMPYDDDLAIYVCDVSFFVGVNMKWSAVQLLARVVAAAWRGSLEDLGNACRAALTKIAPLEAKTGVRELVKVLAEYRSLAGSGALEQFHSALKLPGIPVWPWEAIDEALGTVQEEDEENRAPVPHSPRVCLKRKSDSMRRCSLSSDRRKQQRRRLSIETPRLSSNQR